MGNYLFDMILCGVTYVILVYFMVKLMKAKSISINEEEDDDGDGGVSFSNLPDLDLPPGITLPDGSPGRKKEKEKAEVLV